MLETFGKQGNVFCDVGKFVYLRNNKLRGIRWILFAKQELICGCKRDTRCSMRKWRVQGMRKRDPASDVGKDLAFRRDSGERPRASQGLGVDNNKALIKRRIVAETAGERGSEWNVNEGS